MELTLVKPRVESLEFDEVNNVEKFEIAPLEAGQGTGVFGNSLRVTLLTHIPGYAITNFKIGYRKSQSEDFTMKAHYFDTISGVMPDLTDVSLILKDAKFRLINCKEKEVTINKIGPCTITLADFESEGVKIINPELEILRIVDETEVTMTIKIQEGRGYKDENFFEEEDWISVDALFSPVVRVLPQVSDMRVNGEDGFEKLTLTVETDGRLLPKEALDVAIRIIHEGYSVLAEGAQSVIDNEAIYFDVQEDENKHVVYKNINELNLTVRTFNALKAYGINHTGDLERYTRKTIKNIDNLGKKSLKEIEDKMAELGLEFKSEEK